MGSLVVGLCAAKGLAAGLGIPIISINHMDGHIMSCFIEPPLPSFPFLCLTISGGHTQLTVVRSVIDMEVIGRTRDDAAGEAFDKIGKLLGLPYPAGPHIDKLAQKGEVLYQFTHADVPDFDFSFSGLKTQVMYFLRDELKKNENFIEENRHHVAASVQYAIVQMLMKKLNAATHMSGIKDIAIAGGVSANSMVRSSVQELAIKENWKVHIPSLQYCTDNAAMISIAGYYKYQAGDFSNLGLAPFTKIK
jgi:N6-L-threonylcarbamoyladenine synthase